VSNKNLYLFISNKNYITENSACFVVRGLRFIFGVGT
jgi:hypothetical protein